ncbi:MAG: HRDC domain-containing protein [bacterium]|nr:HRDC domain-containing protein [bacterium]
MPIPPAVYIQTQAELNALVTTLMAEPLVAIDTESNSLHAYRERVCLIQLSTASIDAIIDPLTIPDMQPLAPLMASAQVEKVFHAAEYDIMCLKRDFGYTFANIFDTMVAARVIGYKSIGLSALLETYMGVVLDKAHQRDDWGERPLPADSLAYAQMDTHYLPQLREILHEKLKEDGRLEEAVELFEELPHLPAAELREFDPEGYWKLGMPQYLKRYQMSILREIYLLREEIAQERDLPPFKVLVNKQLVTLATAAPRRLSDLAALGGMPSSFIRRYGHRLLEAIERGQANAANLGSPPRHEPPDPVVTDRYAALHAWRRDRAAQRGVESDVIISKTTLWDLAYKAPTTWEGLQTIRGLGPWRLNAYGEEILNVLEQSRTLSE